MKGSLSKSDGQVQANGTAPRNTEQRPQPKYKHALAVHTKETPSILTTGLGPAPKFDGFRNLMILVISMLKMSRDNYIARAC